MISFIEKHGFNIVVFLLGLVATYVISRVFYKKSQDNMPGLLQDVHFDFKSDPNYDYVGGVNREGKFQINRYSKKQPIKLSWAIGKWEERHELIYKEFIKKK